MGDAKISILIIEESDRDAQFYQKLLENSPLIAASSEITHVKSLQKALELLDHSLFQLIVTNLFLPDSSGLDTFQKISSKATDTPIVILTDEFDEILGLKAVASGAQDCLPKSELDLHFFARIVLFALERHHLQEALKELSFRDELTEVYNRRGFLTIAEQEIELSKRLKKGFSLFLIDLDGLKKINDTYGHLEGDKILFESAQILKKAFRHSDVIGRIGGDEFAVLALSASKEPLGQVLEETIRDYNQSKQHEYNLSLSYGIAYCDANEDLTLQKLFDEADRDLYESKRRHHVSQGI